MIKEHRFGSKYVNIPSNNISSWSASSRGTISAWGTETEQSIIQFNSILYYLCAESTTNNNNNNNNKEILIIILIKITTDFIFMTVPPEIFWSSHEMIFISKQESAREGEVSEDRFMTPRQ
jgi:hypothetical protein